MSSTSAVLSIQQAPLQRICLASDVNFQVIFAITNRNLEETGQVDDPEMEVEFLIELLGAFLWTSRDLRHLLRGF